MIGRVFGVLLALGVMSTTAFAQTAAKIFVASTGADTNDGGRATPKRSFQAAHDAVAAGGEIVVLDTSGYGAVTITKSVGIVVPPGVTGFVTVTAAGGSGITINAGASDIVTLRGLIVEGPGQQQIPTVTRGIYAKSVGTLIVEDTTVQNFYVGIDVENSNSGHLVVRGGTIRNTFDGIQIADRTVPVTIDALVTDTALTLNHEGLAVIQAITGSTLRMAATRCAISDSISYAVIVQRGGASGTAEAVVDGCTITANNVVFANSVGAIYTRGNNTLYNNGSLGSTPTMLAAQ